MRMTQSPRETALNIWQAGVDSVRANALVTSKISLANNSLFVAGTEYSLKGVKRICIVGGGKAAGYLAAAIESLLLAGDAPDIELIGHVNVPANCMVPTTFLNLHAARPAGVNEPRSEGVAGAKKIMRLVGYLEPDDLCICVVTGGGSALLPAPAEGLSLADKIKVTRLMSGRGANIRDLNHVRIALSTIKGGGLARSCTAHRMITVIVSDVIGDPLDLIASGPTFEGPRANAHEILSRYVDRQELPDAVWIQLKKKPSAKVAKCMVDHHILANNDSAVRAAAERAREYGYSVTLIPPESIDTSDEQVANTLLDRLVDLSGNQNECLIWGGEPIVHLAENSGGKGGRNQQLVLRVLNRWKRLPPQFRDRICVLSGGTDGEDGPTDAAGAFANQQIIERAEGLELDSRSYLDRNDAYTFFDRVGGLIKTGPTHTNVCDIRVALLRSH